ncbi:MAG: ferredoxin, partial [Oscillospiraceae bacterium]|nr:ferredoxin [Oscillospiraceae bacterium]
MRKFETSVQELKHEVLKEVAQLAWEDKLTTGVLDIPQHVIPGPEARMRCCIYKERAIVGDRVKIALGGNPAYPGVVEVMEFACTECPVTKVEVAPASRA